jgi:hypothetical protein
VSSLASSKRKKKFPKFQVKRRALCPQLSSFGRSDLLVGLLFPIVCNSLSFLSVLAEHDPNSREEARVLSSSCFY